MAVVSVTKHIPASKDSLWEAISRERNLENFHPFCQSNNVKKWAKDESIDARFWSSYSQNGALFIIPAQQQRISLKK